MLAAFRRTIPFLLLSTAVLTASGCAGIREVRYVYQDGSSGVIGMPENSSRWPTYYRKHAEEMMAQHFPEGYEVIRAEEVVEGSRTLTIRGANAAEIDASGAGQVLSLGRLGRSTSRSQSDSLKIKECRIIYKKRNPAEAHQSGEFADLATWSPARYLDPNSADQRVAKANAGDPSPAAKPMATAKNAAPEPNDEPVLETSLPIERGALPKTPMPDVF